MPFISAIIGAIGAGIAAVGSFIGGLGAIGQMALSIGLNLAVAAISAALAPKPKEPPSGVDLELQLGEDVPRKVRVGRFGVAGHLAYANAFGPGNQYLQQVFVVSDAPITALDKVWIDGELATLVNTGNPAGLQVTNGDYANLIWIKLVDGHQTTADAELVSGSNPADRWTAAHVGHGTAYIVVTMSYDREKLANPPQFFFEGRGAALYDWRKDSTVGGTGLHRWNDQSTWEYSANPIVAAYNYYRGFEINGDIFCGMEMLASDLPLSAWTMAANICDESVSGRTRYVVAIGLDCTLEHGDNIDALMKSCGGMIVDGVDGTWPIVGTNQPTVATLTDADLIVGAPVRFQARRAMNELVNSVSGTYPNPENQWSPAGYERATDAATVAVDRRTRDVAMNFETVPDGEQAAQLAAIYFSENRWEATGQIMVRPRWQVLEPGDWIVWQSKRYGTRTYMVTDMEIASLDGEGPRNTLLSLQERNGGIYDAVTVVPQPVPLGPATPVYATELLDFAVIGIAGVGSNGQVYPAIRVSWTLPTDPTVSGAVIEYRVKAQPDISYDKAVSFDRTIVLLAEGVVSNTIYEVRHRLVTDPTRVTPWSAWFEVTTLDLPNPDLLVGLAEVKDDIEGRFRTLQKEVDDVRTKLTDVGTSLQLAPLANWQTIRKVSERTGQNEASIKVEQIVRAMANEAIAAELATLAANVGGNKALITVERVARADGDTALAAEITSLSAEVDGNAASISAETGARVDADSALAADIATLDANVGDNSAAIAAEQTARADADSALAADIAVLEGSVGDNSAAITTEQSARVNADSALAADIAILEADVGDNLAAIITEQAARADGDSANASSITAVSADLNDRFATGLMKFEAAANQAGVDARFSIMLRAGTADAFKESGLFLELYTDGGIQKSRMAVLADQFVVTDGSIYTLPLVYSGGVLKLQGVKVEWADIVNIVADEAFINSLVTNELFVIGTSNLDFDVVTASAVLTGSSGPPTAIAGVLDTLVIDNPNPNPVLMDVFISASISNGAGAGSGTVTTRVRRQHDNKIIATVTAAFSGAPSGQALSVDKFFIDEDPLQGANTYILEVLRSGGLGDSSTAAGTVKMLWWKR